MKTYTEEEADYVGTVDEIIAACIKDGYRSSYCWDLSTRIKQVAEKGTKSGTIFLIKDNESGGFNVDRVSIIIK